MVVLEELDAAKKGASEVARNARQASRTLDELLGGADAGAIEAGIPIPGLSTSLAWFDTLRTAQGSANLIQAQRDYFGSHTYERRDAEGEFVHSHWASQDD